MSRGVKDLRELICMSRLTIRDSDDDLVFSDGEESTGAASSSGSVEDHIRSPDSGIVSNGRSDLDAGRVGTPMQLASIAESKDERPASSARRKKKKKKKKPQQHSAPELANTQGDLTKASPLPPVGVGQIGPTEVSVPGNLGRQKRPAIAVDNLLLYIDVSVVSDWLSQANQQLCELASWCLAGENFVHFAQFWLRDLPVQQKEDILNLEYSILLDSLTFAFSAGLDAGKVTQQDILQLLSTVFKEYPEKLLADSSVHLFLDYLQVLASDKQSSYKKLLSDAGCSTRNKQHVQIILALRCFALASMWHAVVKFYQRVAPDPSCISSATSGGHCNRLLHKNCLEQAIRNGYIEVINYMVASGKVASTYTDDHARTLVFMAVMHNRCDVLQYLMTELEPRPDVNCPSDTGNTPLHATVNAGRADVMKQLLLWPGVDVNIANKQCDDATPLHLAVMHGNKDLVSTLLAAGANPRLPGLGHSSISELAREFDQQDILDIL